MYTTVAYRVPGEGSIDDLSMSEGAKEEKISSSVEWIAFKQQFFSSVLIRRRRRRRKETSQFQCGQEGWYRSHR